LAFRSFGVRSFGVRSFGCRSFGLRSIVLDLLQVYFKIKQIKLVYSTFQCDSNDISCMGIFKYLVTKSEKSNGRPRIYKT
jgi:hypothetical protein